MQVIIKYTENTLEFNIKHFTQRCPAACADTRRCTGRTTADQSLTSHRGSVYVSSTAVTLSMYRATSSARSADGLLLWLVRPSGTLFRTISDRSVAALVQEH